ncbi:hypothetical protein ACK3TF_005646 [Chlorella vulgaris]
MLLAARKVLPGLLSKAPAALGASSARQYAAKGNKADDDDTFELLPPGCSLKDPTYGRTFDDKHTSLSDPVLNYDQKPVEDYRPLKKRQGLPAPPLNVAAAQAKLQQSKEAKKRSTDSAADEDDDLYVYLPPGSSMRDPVSLPNSMSDPLDNRKVYYRDPTPAAKANKPGAPKPMPPPAPSKLAAIADRMPPLAEAPCPPRPAKGIDGNAHEGAEAGAEGNRGQLLFELPSQAAKHSPQNWWPQGTIACTITMSSCASMIRQLRRHSVSTSTIGVTDTLAVHLNWLTSPRRAKLKRQHTWQIAHVIVWCISATLPEADPAAAAAGGVAATLDGPGAAAAAALEPGASGAAAWHGPGMHGGHYKGLMQSSL